MYTQLTLDLQLKDSFTFENFVAADNQLLIDLLKQQSEQQVYIWGGHNVGKSHLLQAQCHYLGQQGLSVSYLPLEQMIDYSPEVFQGQEFMDVCCVDNVQCLQSKADWQEALFDLINRLREHKRHLLIAANQPPGQLQLDLKDLVSRLQWGPIFKLEELNDRQKCQALQLRAKARGFELQDKVALYLINHYNRELEHLYNVLDALDKAQLAQHRRLTIPFVKSVIS